MTNTIAVFQISSEEDLRFQLDFVGLALTGRTLKVSVRERPSNALKVDLIAPSNLTLAGAGNLTVFYPRASMTSWAKGIEYEADIIDETAGSATRIMAVRFVYDHPGNLVYGVKGNQASVSWGSNQAVVTAIGGVGPPGPANVITIGAVDTLETDEPATASLTGSAPTQVLNLGLPKGNTGTAATIAVGAVTTVAPGTPADVTNSGTSGAAVFDFDIPAGAAATIAAGDVTTISAGQPAAVTNSGTSSAAVFDFDIPAGAAATVAVGTVTESLPGDPPTVTNVGTATAAVFDFALPRGDQGPPGSVVDGDKGDVVVSGGGTVWTVQADAPAIAAMMPKTGGAFTGPISAVSEIHLSGTGGTGYIVSAPAGQRRRLHYRTSNVDRWTIDADDVAEAGGNAGSNWQLVRHGDDGGYIDTPLQVLRSTGQLQLTLRPSFNGVTPFDADNLNKVTTKSAAYSVVQADLANAFVGTGTWTLSLPPATSVGNGFFVKLRNAGTGVITIDPDGAEAINGVASLGAYRGDSVELLCDGTGWHALFQSTTSVVAAEALSGAQAAIDLSLPGEFSKFTLDLDGFEPSVAASLGLRLSSNNGASFYSGSGDYAWAGGYNSSSTSNATTYRHDLSAIFASTGIELTVGNQAAGANQPFGSMLTILPRGGSHKPTVAFITTSTSVNFVGSGYLGPTVTINAIRILYSAGNITAGARYTLSGHRG